jgi:hypothetical protein
MTTTQKQHDANRRNAMKSTGPKTVEGRNLSKLNALKHGLTAAQIVIFDENAQDLENFHEGLIEELLPIGALEEQLVERIAVCAWRLRRVYRIEARLFATAGNPVLDPKKRKFELEQFLIDLPRLSAEQLKAAVKIFGPEDSGDATATAVAPPAEVPDIGAVFRTLAVSQGPLFQLSRHETTIERSLHRALHDLERLQARRKGEAVMAPLVLNISSGG